MSWRGTVDPVGYGGETLSLETAVTLATTPADGCRANRRCPDCASVAAGINIAADGLGGAAATSIHDHAGRPAQSTVPPITGGSDRHPRRSRACCPLAPCRSLATRERRDHALRHWPYHVVERPLFYR